MARKIISFNLEEVDYKIELSELSENPQQDYPDEIDVTITIDGHEYSGNLTKD